jgi:hypothetical protein
MGNEGVSELEARDTVGHLLRGDGRMPESLRKRILALGAASIEPLLEILENRDLDAVEAPGAGYAPVHAAALLAELRAEQAIEPMLRALEHTDALDLLSDQITRSLGAFGPAVLEPALRAHERSRDFEYRTSLSFVLSSSGAKDQRIFAVLLKLLRDNVSMGATALAEYGDPRALQPLQRALDAWELETGDELLANHGLLELECAILALGGSLTAWQLEKCGRARDLRNARRARLGSALPYRPGRNDPCWCGSGAKYKKCHLPLEDGEPRD